MKVCVSSCWRVVVSVACLVAWGVGEAARAGSITPVTASEAFEEAVGWALFSHAAKADFKDPQTPGGKSTVSINEFSLVLPLPLYESDDVQVFAGPQFDWHRFDFEHVPGLDDLDVYAVAAHFGMAYTGVESWEFLLGIAPGFYTDFRKANSGDFKTFAHGMATWRLNNQVMLVLGLAYDSAFGDDDLYPLGGVRWDPTPTLSVQMILPEPVVIWAPSEGLAFFVNALPVGGKWNVRDPENANQEYSFLQESWRVGAGFEVRLADSVWLHAAAGMDVSRNYKIENSDEDYLLKSDADDTWFSRVGIMLR